MKAFQKVMTLSLAVLMLLSFAGCTKSASETDSTTEPTSATFENLSTANPNGLSLEEDGVVYESLAQKAVVKTALAYLARGTRIQYDDSRFNPKDAVGSTGAVYRWQSGVRKSPEEYTIQHTGYSNCAGFTSEVYLAALGINIGETTSSLASIGDARRVYKYLPTGNETDEEQAAVKQEFFSNLKMGDIIVIRYNGDLAGNGHAMLYVGQEVLKNADGYKSTAAEGTTDTGTANDADYTYDIIHSTGNSYNYAEATEIYESHGTVQMMAANSLFDSQNRRYVFGKLESIAIIRPLNNFNGELPENTQNRMLYMDNIIAEKLSSHTVGMTVSPGCDINYTFSITNKNSAPVTLSLMDTIPEGTTFVTSENVSERGRMLSWTVTIPAGETTAVSYTVKVDRNVTPGTYIESTASTVGGITVNCPGVYVGNTLTDAQQAALRSAIEKNAASQLRGMALANALYNDVLDTDDLIPDDYGTVLSSIFSSLGECFTISQEENPYREAIVPGLYGGRYVTQRKYSANIKEQVQMHENNRTRLPQPEHLIAGDILIAAQDAEGSSQKLYLYTGENMLDLNSGETLTYLETSECLEPVLSYNRFAIVRPSLLLDKAAQ